MPKFGPMAVHSAPCFSYVKTENRPEKTPNPYHLNNEVSLRALDQLDYRSSLRANPPELVLDCKVTGMFDPPQID